jgi:hypothetical protein
MWLMWGLSAGLQSSERLKSSTDARLLPRHTLHCRHPVQPIPVMVDLDELRNCIGSSSHHHFSCRPQNLSEASASARRLGALAS